MTTSRLTVLGLLGVAAGLAVVAMRPSRADEPSATPYELRYVSITGDGGNAKAWFEGASPSGARVQETLDRLARDGFRFASIAPAWRAGSVTVNTGAGGSSSQAVTDSAYVLLMERGGHR